MIHKGNSLVDLDRYEESIESYEKVLVFELDNTYALRKNKDAITFYDKALTIDPNNSKVLYGRNHTLNAQ